MSTWPSTRINLGVLTVLENCMYSIKILSSSSMLFIGSRVRVEPKEHPVKKGVPQGNLLGSLLWKIYSEEPRQRAPKAVTSELVNRRDLTLGKSQELINWRKYDRDETILFQPVTLKIMTLWLCASCDKTLRFKGPDNKRSFSKSLQRFDASFTSVLPLSALLCGPYINSELEQGHLV